VSVVAVVEGAVFFAQGSEDGFDKGGESRKMIDVVLLCSGLRAKR
jgi:hypothetical protein